MIKGKGSQLGVGIRNRRIVLVQLRHPAPAHFLNNLIFQHSELCPSCLSVDFYPRSHASHGLSSRHGHPIRSEKIAHFKLEGATHVPLLSAFLTLTEIIRDRDISSNTTTTIPRAALHCTALYCIGDSDNKSQSSHTQLIPPSQQVTVRGKLFLSTVLLFRNHLPPWPRQQSLRIPNPWRPLHALAKTILAVVHSLPPPVFSRTKNHSRRAPVCPSI